MEALRLVSIYIFNGMSKLAHRRRSMPGRPFQIPYPTSHRRQSARFETMAPNFGRNDVSAADATGVAAAATSVDLSSMKENLRGAPPGRIVGAGDSHGMQKFLNAPAKRRPLTVIEAQHGIAAELLADDARLKRFMLRLEDETIKLLEPTEEGIKVPRPVPYPHYLTRPPEIPISQTYTSVLRRLYNEKQMIFAKPEFPLAIKKFPKKPKVPPYLQSEIVEQRQKTVKLLLKSQDSEVENDEERNLVVAFGRTAQRWQMKNLH